MEEEKKPRIYKTIMLVIMVAVITFIITTIFMYKKIGKDNNTKYILYSKNQNETELEQRLNSFKKLIDEVYLGEVNEEKLIDGAIKGYIEGLNDPYSSYYTKDEMEDIKKETFGNFYGVGVYITTDTVNNQVLILAPIKGSAAEKAGILSGDVITKVDGVEYKGDQLDIVSSKLKGEENSTVEIEILRKGETKTFTITREKVKLNHIESEIKGQNIGYLKISSFDEECADEFKEKFNELKSQGIKSLIIDLRNNGGGIVDEALNIADMIIEKDKTLLITLDKKNNEEVIKSENDAIIDMPIVVLTNKNTASASEILAGILKDYQKAKIVGTKTYGKGVIQELMFLTDGTGIKLTTNEYLTPNRNKINNVGITPDEEVTLPDEVANRLNIDEEKDTQLQKAIEILK